VDQRSPGGLGAGGPERWPEARPYHLPDSNLPDSQLPDFHQDHLGFHIFDWYLAICQEELGCRLPVFLLRAGQRLEKGCLPSRCNLHISTTLERI